MLIPKPALLSFAALLLAACSAPATISTDTPATDTLVQALPGPEPETSAETAGDSPLEAESATENQTAAAAEIEPNPELNLSQPDNPELERDLLIPEDEPLTPLPSTIVETSPELPPPPQPLLLQAGELELQLGPEPAIEVSIQPLAQQTYPQLEQEERPSSEPTPAAPEEPPTTFLEPEPADVSDADYQRRINQLLRAEMELYQQRPSVAYEIYMELGQETGDPNISAKAYEAARSTRDIGKMSAAIDLWLQQDPSNQEALNLYTLQLLQDNLLLQALANIERLHSLGGEVDFRMPMQALIFPSERQARELLGSYRRLAMNYPEREDVWASILGLSIYLASVLDYQQRYQEAADLLAGLENIELGWGLIDADAANRHLVLYAGINEQLLSPLQMRQWYQETIAANPDNVDLRLLQLRHLPDPTLEARVLSVHLLTRPSLPEILSLRAQSQDLELDSTLEALDFYLNLRTLAGDRRALVQYALIAQQNGELSLADEYLLQIYNEPAARASAYLARLQLWLEGGELGIAEQIYRSAWQEQQLPPLEAALIYAQALAIAGYDNEGISLLTLQLQTAPDIPTMVRILQTRAEIYLHQGSYALMEADFRQVIARSPQDSSAYNALGYILANINTRLDESERLIGKALSLAPDNPSYVDSLGWLAFRRGELKRSQELIEWSYRRLPDAEIAAHLGEVYWELDERERAIYVWLKALEDDEEHEVLTETIVRLSAAAGDSDLKAHLVALLQTITAESEQ